MNLMVEDSKTWFEIYEVAIAVYEENDKYLNKIENNNNEDKIGAFQFQQLESFETKLTEKIFDLPILNVQGGTYPSSKINCVIGQVMLSVWEQLHFATFRINTTKLPRLELILTEARNNSEYTYITFAGIIVIISLQVHHFLFKSFLVSYRLITHLAAIIINRCQKNTPRNGQSDYYQSLPDGSKQIYAIP